MWFVYVIYNADSQKIYIGESGNVEERIRVHNQKRGNHFTAKFTGEWKLIYKEKAVDRKAALAREKQLKSYRGREYIKNYIPR
ncbi:MAG TPA: GIY-YIG nuclease family protein [Candidatus Saccharimonadales bacterium]|nr:GIY-YIG nuclease family protein [Candidatus Saccharimonadales bacterium]